MTGGAGSGEWTAAGPAQTRFWFVHELSEGDPAAHLPLCWRLDGAPDRAVLEAALDDVARRHDVLRTVYALRGGCVRQRVLPAVAAVEDLGSAATGAGSLRLVEEFARRPFDLAAGPVWRAGLITECPADTVLFVFVVHHIAFDGWSEHVFVAELARAYAARAAGRAPEPEPEPMRPAEHVAWVLDRAARADDARAFWAAELRGSGPLPLPPPHDGEAGLPDAECFTETALASPAMGEVARLATRARTSRFTVFLAVYVRVMGLLLDIDDLCVGVPFLGRDHQRAESSIGCFVEPLPVRLHIDRSAPFATTLADVGDALLRVLDWTTLPFDEIVRESRIRRGPRHPLFQTMFAYQQTRSRGSPWADVRARSSGCTRPGRCSR